MNRYYKLLLHVFLPLATGLLIYFLFRYNTWLHAQFFAGFRGSPLIRPEGSLLRLLAYSGPDFCWAYALSASIFFWQQWTGVKRVAVTGLCFLLLAGSEIIQVAGTGFTFDWQDLAATFLAFGLSYIVIYRYETF